MDRARMRESGQQVRAARAEAALQRDPARSWTCTTVCTWTTTRVCRRGPPAGSSGPLAPATATCSARAVRASARRPGAAGNARPMRGFRRRDQQREPQRHGEPRRYRGGGTTGQRRATMRRPAPRPIDGAARPSQPAAGRRPTAGTCVILSGSLRRASGSLGRRVMRTLSGSPEAIPSIIRSARVVVLGLKQAQRLQ